jgi:hypothetical protein
VVPNVMPFLQISTSQIIALRQSGVASLTLLLVLLLWDKNKAIAAKL